ncbi:MAG: trypsin-like peptidase domain-containing protein [Nitrosomonadales bacterium]|nr:trypsin-like peptidase domain-containing protein [Nitrosomonadales bacterium]
MGIDDFFDDDYLDFDSDDDFEESLKSESFISKLNNFKDSITPKHLLTITGVVASIFIVYFINYRFNFNETELTSENTNTLPSTTVEESRSETLSTTTSTSTTVAKSVPITIEDNPSTSLKALQSTVMVALPDCGYMGSGTIISKLGFIMTNEHVISDDGTNCNDYIVILISESGDTDPIPKYLAKIVTENVQLDVAILEITGTYDGSSLPRSFENMCIGDSETIALGDELLIWGYPDVRVDSFDSLGRIDLSQGFVSGFDAETNLSEKAWVSLSSNISSGNSGGGAYNSKNELVGVPTAVLEGNYSSRGLLRPINLILRYFDSFYFENCS